MTAHAPLVIGDALIDEMRTETETTEAVGGAALNVAAGLSRLDEPASLLAMISDDEAGGQIHTYLDQHGVAVIVSPSPLGSSRAVSVRKNGEPSYEFNAAAQNRAIDFSGERAAAVRDAAAVIVSCYPFDNVEQSEALLTLVSEKPQQLYIVDANARPTMIASQSDYSREFLRHAPRMDAVKISDEDAEYLFGQDARSSAQLLLDHGAGSVLATYGAHGAEVFTPDFRVAVDIANLPGSIVDTMGGGDATLATVVARIWRTGLPKTADAWRPILEEAMLNAAATCRSHGALLHTPAQLNSRG